MATSDKSRLTPAGKVALEACRKFPDLATRTIARMLVEKRPKLFTSVEQARGIVRDLRGNHGRENRAGLLDHGVRRPNGKAGTTVHLPEPVVESWEPLVLDGAKKVLCLSDVHIPYHDKAAVEAAVNEGKRQKPDVVLLNGDIADFYSISRFQKDPERRDVVAEITMLVQFMRWIRQQFPKARCIIKEGNHEERLSAYLWNAAPVLWQLQQLRLPGLLAYEYGQQIDQHSPTLEPFGWEFVGDQRPVLAAKLPILHGHELPKGMTNPVNMARGAYLRTAHTILVGHGHRSSHHVEPDMWHKEVACWSQGCLCGLHPEYARVNKWNHGFSVVDVREAGQFDVSNFRISDGKIRAS